jgi:hypothetical protein
MSSDGKSRWLTTDSRERMLGAFGEDLLNGERKRNN